MIGHDQDSLHLTRTGARRVSDAVHKVEARPTVYPSPPAARQAQSETTAPVQNDTGETIAAGSVVWLNAVESDGRTITATKPAYSGIPNVGIAAAAIPNGGRGRVHVVGARCKLTVYDYWGDGVAAGDRAGARGGYWPAQVHEGGVFQIDRILSTSGSTVTAWVTIIGELLDNKIVDCAATYGSAPSEAYRLILLAPTAFTLTADAVGSPIVGEA
ncbi:MAG TPA: hypothetical protein VM285_01805 [Polyangia bacterium]|nr:hypothetical protein [Polyangia bacterium]